MKRCPEGHELAPGKISRSWDTELKAHVLYCWNGCNGHSRIALKGGGGVGVLPPRPRMG